MTVEEVGAFFRQHGLECDVKPVQHGQQVRARTQNGECVTVYDSGKAVVGGKASPLKDELLAWNQSGFLPAAPQAEAGDVANLPKPGLNTNVFIVYGHDTVARDSLELLIRRMGLEPIVLANLPAEGETIIEKLEKYRGRAETLGSRAFC